VATLTYVYSDSTAVLGPLATMAEPHSYDLCAQHADRLTAPRGWEVVRLLPDIIDETPTPDDLVALADAVREAGRPQGLFPRTAPGDPADGGPAAWGGATADGGDGVRRGHLRVLRGEG